jgi:CheY-like chemotaxis protein
MQREFQFADRQDVLYIEDHPTNVHLMQALFKRRPQLNLVVAEDGAAARRIARQIQPALLLVDLRLPDCHGSELLEDLRQIDGWAELPAVAVTAEAGFAMAGTSFCEIWPKPLDLAHVLERLDHLLANRALFAPPPSPEFAHQRE